MEQNDINGIIETYANMVYRLAVAQLHSKYDADDVFQEVFLRYVKAAPRFESEEHRKAWLLRVTVNCCRRAQGSFWRKRVLPLTQDLSVEDPEEGAFFDLLAGLPAKYRTVLHLYYYEEYSTEEIAGIVGQKPSTVRSQLARGRALLREQLKGAGEHG